MSVCGVTRVLCLFLLLVLVWSVAGCGGGDGVINFKRDGTISPDDLELADGSHADDYGPFRATRHGLVVVTMEQRGTSPVDDPYVLAWWGTASDFDSSTLIGYDDDSGEGLNARLVFTADKGDQFKVRCTTFGPDDFGTYRVTVREVDSVSPMPPRADAAEAGKAAVNPQSKQSKGTVGF